ncbi:SRPBCC family protein [Streptomyces sp. CRN 30]|uniref:SRPBCC family protein n=1 Tax=Streptomyces sp. CRN 30 TaxID=3075613 RepID=UPI002A7F92CC|nr:SRPBCC family protein [Streptomyces sp. CRN 30]
MTEYERSRTMPAAAGEVFERAADAGRLDGWLPRDLHVRVDDPPAVTVREDRTGEDTAALLRARPEQLRLEWGTRDQGSYAGWLQVAGIDDASSEVTVHLSFFDDRHDPGRTAVDDALETSLSRLRDEVSRP